MRHTGEKPRKAATVFTVRNAAGDKRHFAVEGGKVTEHESYEAGFGAMLLEAHATRGFEHNGQFCRMHRYSLCWAGYELYKPKSADELAALRVTRDRNKAEREEQAWAEAHPLFVWADLREDDRKPDQVSRG